MNELNILKSLKNKDYKPVYFLTGEEPYYIDRISDYIENNVLAEGERDFNLSIFYGGDSSMDEIISSAKRFPMMSERQVIIIKEAQALKDWKTKNKTDLLEKYLAAPLESTILVFQHKHKSLDGRSQIAKAIKASSVYYESKKQSEYKIPNWITDYVKSKNRNIDTTTSALLTEYLGNDLNKIVNALEKLLILVKENEQITSLHVEKNIGISKDYTIFEFQKALGAKNILQANKIINYYSANPKAYPLPMLLPILYKYFTRLIKLHRLPPGENAAHFLGVSPYGLNDFNLAKRNYNAGSLARIIGHLRKADTMSKGVNNPSTTAEQILKELTYKILHDPK
ncbi:MAG: DNA polymerase III subunit delta [Flavobacteriales bacterium]